MTEEVTTPQVEQSLGEQLSNARQAAGISIEQMAKKLKLSISQIASLEQDDYSQLGPVTFVKGHIRSYCREFNLDEKHILSSFFHQKEEDEKKMQSFSRRTEKEASDNRLMLFSYVVIALIIGSSIFIFWQNRDKEPVNDVLSATPSAVENEATDTAEVNKIELALESAPVMAQQTDSTQTVDSEVEQQPDTENEIEQQVVVAAEPEETPIETAKTANTNTSNTIVMTFRDDSWVEIFDAEGERIAFGVKKKGYVMTVEGKSPFRVVLGKHYIVDVELDGEKVDLSAFPTNRLAKFSLPLSE